MSDMRKRTPPVAARASPPKQLACLRLRDRSARGRVVGEVDIGGPVRGGWGAVLFWEDLGRLDPLDVGDLAQPFLVGGGVIERLKGGGVVRVVDDDGELRCHGLAV